MKKPIQIVKIEDGSLSVCLSGYQMEDTLSASVDGDIVYAHSGEPLWQFPQGTNYLAVAPRFISESDSDNVITRSIYVHRLVCTMFHENPEDKPCVNHIDSDPENNSAKNLEWATPQENQIHRVKREIDLNIKHNRGNVRYKEQKYNVVKLTSWASEIRFFKTIASAARFIGCTPQNVSMRKRTEEKPVINGWEIEIVPITSVSPDTIIEEIEKNA